MSWLKCWTQSPAESWRVKLLSPLSSIFCYVARNRYIEFQLNPPAKQTSAMVVVVGNIVVGGTGKTPFISWLYRNLVHKGFKVGVVSRGYGGQSKKWPLEVTSISDPIMVGDEPVMLTKQLGCPMAVSPKRVEAIRLLERNYDLDIIISDDGLQHFKMARDVEIVIVDGQRGFGNQYCLPAGPLREPTERLEDVDFIVSNGELEVEMPVKRSVETMMLKIGVFRNVADPSQILPETAFAKQKVHAIAGIGNPQRFFNTLKSLEIRVSSKEFADHKAYDEKDFLWVDSSKPLLMTEKDAVKCKAFAQPNWWYLEVSPQCSSRLATRILERIRQSV